ncbi:hypothetical protein HY480_01735 [Candidatus Uhrbacteria bacterium]|nr:hypothetical protein [Candidatus Uhrbacteria bacterium]
MSEGTKYRLADLQTMPMTDIVRIARIGLKIPQHGLLGDRELREAVIVHARQAGRLDEVSGPSDPAVSKAVATPSKVVYASYPPYTREPLDGLVGKTVAQAFDMLREPWSIDRDARVLVNGEPVSDRARVLAADDRLEFSRPAGAKG